MNIRQLEYFVTVVDQGSFTEAAASLRVAQSTLSSGVSALERTLGGPLLERNARSVELTSLGRRSLPAAREAVEAVRRLRHADSASPISGHLRIGIVTGLGRLDLPSCVAEYSSHHPHVDLSLRVHPQGSTGLIRDTRLGRLDLAIISAPYEQVASLDLYVLTRQPFVALLPPNHPLASRSAVALRDLADETFIDMPTGFGVRDQIDAAFTHLGQQRRVRLEVPDITTIPAYVQAGLGVAVTTLSERAARDVVTVPVEGLPEQHLSLIHRESPPATVPPFIDIVRRFC